MGKIRIIEWRGKYEVQELIYKKCPNCMLETWETIRIGGSQDAIFQNLLDAETFAENKVKEIEFNIVKVIKEYNI